jgi:hypothetical protein
MVRIISGAVIAAVVMFVWGFVFWGLLPTASSVIKGPPDAEGLRSALKGAPTGVYRLPDLALMSSADEADRAEHARQFEEGPIATVFVRAEGAQHMAPSTMVAGFVHMLVSCLLMAILLHVVRRAGTTYLQRAIIVGFAGTVGTVFSNLGAPIWWFHPWNFHALNTLYMIWAWILAGLVLAAFIKPPAEAVEAG